MPLMLRLRSKHLQVKGNSAIVFSAGAAAGISLGGSTNFLADPPSTVIPAMSVVQFCRGVAMLRGTCWRLGQRGKQGAVFDGV